VFCFSRQASAADSDHVANHPSSSEAAPARREAEGTPRLLLRFAVYSGIVLLSAGLAILWTVNREVASRAERTVEAQARAVAEENLRRQLVPTDFVAPVRGRRLVALDDLFRRRILIPGVVGSRLFNRSGTITYAARHQLIGTTVPYTSQVADVFAGQSKRRVTRTVSWRGKRNVKVLQSLIPVRRAGSMKPIGALELDQNYNAVNISLDDAGHRLLLILTVAFLVLYLSLFPILRRVTSQLATRNERLREQAIERESLLSAERAARAEAESIQRVLAEQNERLRELDRMKDEFVSLVSHELRTPLTSIRGYIALLAGESRNLTPKQQRFLTVVDRNSQRLLELVGDLLFLAKIDAGKFTIELDEIDLAQVVEESIEACRPIADARQIEVVASMASLPLPLLGDRARLGQVLDNLLSNALKFTAAGGRVDVRLSTSDGHAVLEVEDTGLGISAEEQPLLFERFFRSSRATEKAIPGTGLGLAITKAIVDRHGGRITLVSQEDVGTKVRVKIPTETPRDADIAARELAA
jgi:signal transduction histidine kinase